MDPIPFEERDALSGRKVRVISEEQLAERYKGTKFKSVRMAYLRCIGGIGTILPNRARLPWADASKMPYTTLPIVMDNASYNRHGYDFDDGRGPLQVSYVAVDMVELVEEHDAESSQVENQS